MAILLSADLVQDQLLLIAIGGFLSFLIGLIAWNRGYFRFPYKSEHDLIPLQNKDVFGAFFVFIGTEFILLPLILLIFFFPHLPTESEPAFQDPLIKGWLNAGAMFLVTFNVFIYTLIDRPGFKTIWGEASFKGLKRNLHNISLGIISWPICYPIVVTISQIIALTISELFQPAPLEQMAVKHLRSTFESPLLFGVTWFLVVFLVPIAEETLFRGYLQTWIRQTFGTKIAILLTSLIFAFFHFASSQGLGNIELLCALFVLACFLGFVYERQRSLWAPIALHATFNAISIAMM